MHTHPPPTKQTSNNRGHRQCARTDFKCKTHQHTCIPREYVCDGLLDCVDHSDELDCPRSRSKKDHYRANIIGLLLPRILSQTHNIHNAHTHTNTHTCTHALHNWTNTYADNLQLCLLNIYYSFYHFCFTFMLSQFRTVADYQNLHPLPISLSRLESLLQLEYQMGLNNLAN